MNIITHEAFCARRMQKCSSCNEMIDKLEYFNHVNEAHQVKECAFCHEKYEKWLTEAHVEQCMRRFEHCNYCSLKISKEKLDDHKAVCGSRTKACENCGLNLLLRNLADHEELCLQMVGNSNRNSRSNKGKPAEPLKKQDDEERSRSPSLVEEKSDPEYQPKRLKPMKRVPPPIEDDKNLIDGKEKRGAKRINQNTKKVHEIKNKEKPDAADKTKKVKSKR